MNNPLIFPSILVVDYQLKALVHLTRPHKSGPQSLRRNHEHYTL
jgi:hypothetical protein